MVKSCTVTDLMGRNFKNDLNSHWQSIQNLTLLLIQIFFIDHANELTTFIDPRLPLPDTPYSYNPDPQKSLRQMSEPFIRPHHTVVTHGQSLDIDLTPTPAIPEPGRTTPTSVPTPTSSGGLTTPTGLSSNRLSIMSVASSASVEVTPICEYGIKSEIWV